MATPIYNAAGTATSNATSQVLPDWPAGIAAGKYVILEVAHKYDNRTVTTPTGFSLLGAANAGLGTDGTSDQGSLKLLFYGKEADGTESGTIDVSTTGGTASCLFARTYMFGKTSGTTWNVSTLVSGTDVSAGTLFSVTYGSDPGLAADDMCAIGWAVNSDAYTHGTHTFAATGVTATVASRGNAAVTAGTQMRVGFVTAAITAGPATDVATYTNTASGSSASAPTGPSVMIRLREVASGGIVVPKFVYQYNNQRRRS